MGEITILAGYNNTRFRRYCYIVAGVLTSLMIGIFFSINHIFPFGDLSVSWCDMNQQIMPMLLNFKDILSGKGNILLNMQNGGGMNFWGVFLFYICSPFSFLVIFVSKTDIKLFMNVIIMLKMITCAVTASIFFKRCFKRLDPWFNIILSVMYAFSGYVMMFYQISSWIDVMYMLPLLLMAFEELIYRKRIVPYIICISLMIIFSFYIGYMVVVFTVMFFGVYIIFEKKAEDKRAVCARFILGSVIGAFLTAVVWLPSFIQYIVSARGKPIIDSISEDIFIAPLSTVIIIVACTSIIPASMFCSRDCLHSKRAKMYLTLFVAMLIPMIIEPVNKMWHTGSYQAFPARYGFLTIFCGLVVTAIVLSNPKNGLNVPRKKNIRNAILCAIVVVAFISCEIKYSADNVDFLNNYVSSLWGNKESGNCTLALMIFMIIPYTLVLYLYRTGKLKRCVVIMLLVPLMFTESMTSVNNYIVGAARDTDVYEAIISMSDKIEDDDDFYRVKMNQKDFEVNLVGSMGYNSMAHYSSLSPEDYLYTMKKLGYSSYWLEIGSHCGTVFTDAILCNKYSIGAYRYDDDPNSSFYAIRPSEFYVPLGIVTADDLSEHENIISEKRFDIQDELFRSICNVDEDLMRRYTYDTISNINVGGDEEEMTLYRIDNTKDGKIQYAINVSSKETLYFDCFDNLSVSLREHVNDSFDIYVNGKRIYSGYPSQKYNGLLRLGTFENETVNVDLILKEDVYCKSFGIAGIKNNIVERNISNINSIGLIVDGCKINGSYTADDDDCWAFISIPYDKGFKAKINGKKAEIYRVYDDFMAIKLTKGENDIKITYRPVGFTLGLILSLLGLLLVILIIRYNEKILQRVIKYNKISYYLTIILSAFVALCIYIAPIFVNVFVD